MTEEYKKILRKRLRSKITKAYKKEIYIKSKYLKRNGKKK